MPLPNFWDEERKQEQNIDNTFNCVPLELDLEDIKKLEKNIKGNKLKPVAGFFFGDQEPDEDTKKEELEILKRAKKHIANGYQIFYDSWW